MSGLFSAGSYIAILPTVTTSASTAETQGTNVWTSPTNVRTLNNLSASASVNAVTATRNMILTLGGLSGIPSGAHIISIKIGAYWYYGDLNGLGFMNATLSTTGGATIYTLYVGNGVDAGTPTLDEWTVSGSGYTGANLSGATVNLKISGGGEAASGSVDYIWVEVTWS